MSEPIVGHARVDIKAGDLVHITVTADGTWESPEIRFVPDVEPVAVEPNVGVVEAELPKEEPSEHVETT